MEIKRSDIIIDGQTATWSLKMEGAIHGTYIGTFKFRCFLTPTQKIAAGREFRELLGAGNPYTPVPENESFTAYALTQLKHRVLESPPFWKTSKEGGFDGDLVDDEVLSTVLSAATEAELKYREQLIERKETALQRAIKAAESHLSNKDNDAEESEEDDEE